MEGFESTLTKLPEIADRKLSPFERVMRNRVEGLANKVAGTIDKALKEGQANADSFRKNFQADLVLPEEPEADPNTKAPVLDSSEKKKGGSAPGVEGLEQLNQRILNAAAKRRDNAPVVDALNKIAVQQGQLPKKIAAAQAAQKKESGPIEVMDKALTKVEMEAKDQEAKMSERTLTALELLNKSVSSLNTGLV